MKNKKENKNNKDKKIIYKMARNIMANNNVDAYKLLEKVMKNKVSDKIDKALNEI